MHAKIDEFEQAIRTQLVKGSDAYGSSLTLGQLIDVQRKAYQSTKRGEIWPTPHLETLQAIASSLQLVSVMDLGEDLPPWTNATGERIPVYSEIRSMLMDLENDNCFKFVVHNCTADIAVTRPQEHSSRNPLRSACGLRIRIRDGAALEFGGGGFEAGYSAHLMEALLDGKLYGEAIKFSSGNTISFGARRKEAIKRRGAISVKSSLKRGVTVSQGSIEIVSARTLALAFLKVTLLVVVVVCCFMFTDGNLLDKILRPLEALSYLGVLTLIGISFEPEGTRAALAGLLGKRQSTKFRLGELTGSVEGDITYFIRRGMQPDNMCYVRGDKVGLQADRPATIQELSRAGIIMWGPRLIHEPTKTYLGTFDSGVAIGVAADEARLHFVNRNPELKQLFVVYDLEGDERVSVGGGSRV